MSNYWDPVFLKHLQGDSIHHVCEVGARYGDESIMLSNIFTKAQILSFECNPVTVERCRQSLALYPSIKFFDHGLGASAEVLPFYSYTQNNDGASSLHKRIDFDAWRRALVTGGIMTPEEAIESAARAAAAAASSAVVGEGATSGSAQP